MLILEKLQKSTAQVEDYHLDSNQFSKKVTRSHVESGLVR